jgi:hypothetical protein
MKEFESITGEIIDAFKYNEQNLLSLSEEILTNRKNNQNRTAKQILGHLIDSTSNNIHRIVYLQYMNSPVEYPNYATFGNNDRWIAIQDYQNEDWNTMIQLLKYSLLHYCHVVKNIDETKLENEWIAGPARFITLRKMIGEFLPHLRLHLNEIEELTK